MDDFFRTPMGRTFFESTLPRLVRAIERVADAGERNRPQNADKHVSLNAVLESLAGMKFPEPGGAYDYVKKAFNAQKKKR